MIHDVAAWASLSELNDSSLVSRFCTYQKKKSVYSNQDV